MPKKNESVFITGMPKSGKLPEKHQIYFLPNNMN